MCESCLQHTNGIPTFLIKDSPLIQSTNTTTTPFTLYLQSSIQTLSFFFFNLYIMPIDKQQPIPPPVIGKIGYYTVFVTPNPKSSSESSSVRDSDPQKKKNYSPVQPPPVQYEKTASSYGSNFGFFWDAIAKLQTAHSNLDDYLAHWFGLNQSKYQWALDDYYENESMEKVERKAKDLPNKAQK